uniref:Uncharacterized protein n=1 Tax=Daphnia magna TaxID=35525 RepID=A0A0P6BXC6_9CRUS
MALISLTVVMLNWIKHYLEFSFNFSRTCSQVKRAAWHCVYSIIFKIKAVATQFESFHHGLTQWLCQFIS